MYFFFLKQWRSTHRRLHVLHAQWTRTPPDSSEDGDKPTGAGKVLGDLSPSAPENPFFPLPALCL